MQKIKVEGTVVELDGDEMTRIIWKLIKDRVPPGGAFTAHNVSGQENHMRDFLEAVHGDPEFQTTIHTTSRAGVSVSIRRK